MANELRNLRRRMKNPRPTDKTLALLGLSGEDFEALPDDHKALAKQIDMAPYGLQDRTVRERIRELGRGNRTAKRLQLQ